MRRKLLASFLALAALGSLAALGPATAEAQRRRRPARRAPQRPPAPGVNHDARVAQIADAYLSGHYSFNPTEGTAAGLHEYDSRLEERGPEALAREARRLRSTLAELSKVSEWRLSPEPLYDFMVLRAHARSRLLGLEELGDWARDPRPYARAVAAGVDHILRRDYAPFERRLDALLAREREAARLLAEARSNLSNPSRLATETAIEEAAGAVEFFARVVPQMFERAGGSRLSAARRAEFHSTNDGVVAALRSFRDWLASDLLPRSNGDYRLGAELLKKSLLASELIDPDPDALVREGELVLREAQDELRAAAELAAPGRGLSAALELLARERPTAGGLVGEARAELDRLRAFVRAEALLTPPVPESLTVAETPPYERALNLTAVRAPGPFEREAVEGFYFVTPPDPEWDAARREEHLGQFNRYRLIVTSMGEAQPGRFYQLMKARQSASRVRAALQSRGFSEGWAVYSEQLMLEEGFGGNNPLLRLAQLSSSLLHLCRHLAALRVHAQGMSYEQAVSFFEREAYLSPSNAEREARRVALDPGCAAAMLGRRQILRLRADWRGQMGDSFRLGDFHDRLLSYGAPPVRVLRLAMLGDDSDPARAGAAAQEQARPVEFSVVATGTTSGHEGGRRVELVSTPEEWRRVWNVIGGGRPVPDVNFETRAVIVAYQGRQPTGGYSVEAVAVSRAGTVIAFQVNERRPASGDITTQAITSPFVAVSIPRPAAGTTVRFAGDGGAREARPARERNVRPRPRPNRRRRPGRG
ncbi:MAG TPA: DUF885 family protein [Pyrinomonadaceae bacterium]|nr:DUF885 family protein [Pyrinomonadaceae bacterium]